MLFLLGALLPVMAQEQELPLPGIPSIPAEPEVVFPPTTPESIITSPTTPGESIQPPSETPPLELPPQTTGKRIRIRSQRQLFSPSLGVYQFFGEVVVEFNGTTVFADEVSYSEKTRLALARGNVSIRQGDAPPYWGNLLEINVITERFRFIDASVEYPPGFLGPPFIAPVFINGREFGGLPTEVHVQNARVTTCDLPEPHYTIVSREVDIYPGDKLIARDNDIYLLNRRILHIPWFFMTLKQNRTPIVPEFGQNEEEGYYGRFLYQYVLNPNQLGGIRLDITEKLGIGLGVRHFYSFPQGDGEAFVYGRQGLDEYLARVDHTQSLPWDMRLNARGDIRQNSRFTPQPTTVTDINTTLSRVVGTTNTRLLFTRRLSQQQFGVDSVNTNLVHSSPLPYAGGDISANLRYSSFRNTTGDNTAANQDLATTLNWARALGVAKLNVAIDQRTDIDDDRFLNDSIFGLQRLPEITLAAKQEDLKLNFLRPLDSTFTLGWGMYDELPTVESLARYSFLWQSSLSPVKFGPETLPTTLTGNLRFLQTIYGDKDTTAQYMYDNGLTANTRFGNWSNVLRYSLRDSDGFPALATDRVYPNNTINENLQYTTDNLSGALTVGRDIGNDRWWDMSFRSFARISANITTAQSLGYDLNEGRWRDLNSQYTWRDDPRVSFTVGTRYSLEEGRLQQVSSGLSWVISPLWRAQWLSGVTYSAFEKNYQLQYNQLLITRDLHCWDASLYLSSEPQSLGLYVRLKALNIALPQFGIGAGGQVLSPNLDTAL